MSDEIMKAVQEITRRHREIINDWCKAYLSQLYEEGVDIKPGSFTLNEQNLDNVGGSVFGKKYWFEKGTPSYSNWIDVKDKSPDCKKVLAIVHSQKNAIYNMGHFGWYRDTIYTCWMNGDSFIIESHGPELPATHWMPLPSPPEENELD